MIGHSEGCRLLGGRLSYFQPITLKNMVQNITRHHVSLLKVTKCYYVFCCIKTFKMEEAKKVHLKAQVSHIVLQQRSVCILFMGWKQETFYYDDPFLPCAANRLKLLWAQSHPADSPVAFCI